MSGLRDRVQETKREQGETRARVASGAVRPTADEQEKVHDVIRRLSDRFSGELLEKGTGEAGADGAIASMRDRIAAAVPEECGQLDIPYEEQVRIEQAVIMTVLGNGPIEKYMQDPDVTEIVVQRYDNVVYERNGKIERSDVTFNDEKHLQTIISRIVQRVGRQINMMTPIVDARLPDGSRVNATIPPVTPEGATLTIRKFSHAALSADDYIRLGAMDRRMLYFLMQCVRGKINLFVSGGTGTGKTTLLNMLSRYIPEDELILTIEDTLELQLQQRNVRREEVRLSTSDGMMRVDQKQLVKSALRQRPDRIILGEVRDGSVVELISAASTGHDGTMTTVHANSPRNMCDIRIPILFSMNGDVSFSERSVAMQISESVQVIAQITRFPDGSRKVSEIASVEGLMKDGKVKINTLFFYDRESGKFRCTGHIPGNVLKKASDYGVAIDADVFAEDAETEGGGTA